MQAKSDHRADSTALKAFFNKLFEGMQSIKAENHLKNFMHNLVKPLKNKKILAGLQFGKPYQVAFRSLTEKSQDRLKILFFGPLFDLKLYTGYTHSPLTPVTY